MEVTTRLRRRLLRRIAYLRRNRCSVLLAGLLSFILVHPLVAEFGDRRDVSCASERSSSFFSRCGRCTRAVARS